MLTLDSTSLFLSACLCPFLDVFLSLSTSACMFKCVCVRHLNPFFVSYIEYRMYIVFSILYVLARRIHIHAHHQITNTSVFSFVVATAVAAIAVVVRMFIVRLLPFSMRELNNCSRELQFNSVLFCIWTLMHIHTRYTTVSPIYHIFISFNFFVDIHNIETQ